MLMPNCAYGGTAGNEELQLLDEWKDQRPDTHLWDLEPLKEGITPDPEPAALEGWEEPEEPDQLIEMAEYIYYYYKEGIEVQCLTNSHQEIRFNR